MELPPELIDEITFYAEASSRILPGDEIKPRREKTDPEGRASLACLRLANKVFCRCATPLLFRHIDATVGKISRLRDVSTSPYAGYVRHVDLGTGRSASSDRAENARCAEDLAELLAPCLGRLPKLSSLDFVGGTSSYVGGELSPEINKSLINSLKTSLVDVDLPQPRELDLGFPTAGVFTQLLAGEAPSSGHRIWPLVGRLRHLGLHIQEAPTRRPFQRILYLRSFRDILGAAQALQSLAISSTETVTLANFHIPTAWRLRSLALGHMESPSEKLEEVIGTSRDSLESIQLRDVD
ncbi:hypothetical protein PG985_009629 [Apiospora marii]|uniref:uncharacterized protein n=1 Tax=Apiospora marii TaxID=335849 RepID=UPI00313015BC